MNGSDNDNEKNNSSDDEAGGENIVGLSPQLKQNNYFKPKGMKKSNFSSGSKSNIVEIKTPKYIRLKEKINSFIDSIPIICFMSFLTIYALFGDDIRLLAHKVQLFLKKDLDNAFYAISLTGFLVFFIELTLSSWAKEGYFLSYYFYLDLISTFSLLLDVGWINEALMGKENEASSVQSTAGLARAGRASRIGTRAGRIIRVLRLIRLVKLYKHAQQILKEKEKERMSTFAKSRQSLRKENGSIQPSYDDKRNSQKTDMEMSQTPALNFRISQTTYLPENTQMIRMEGDISITQIGSKNENTRRCTGNELRIPIQRGSITDKKTPKRERKRFMSMAAKNIIFNKSDTPSDKAKKAQNALQFPSTEDQEEEEKFPSEEKEIIELQTESNVGKKLSDLTTKRVITIVLSVIISIPMLNQLTFVEDANSFEYGLRYIDIWLNDTSSDKFQLAKNTYINNLKNVDNPLIYLAIKPDNNTEQKILFESFNYKDLRSNERIVYNYQQRIIAIADLRFTIKNDAWFGIGRTIFITLVLTLSALTFNKDANDLVLAPIETMLQKVKRISSNPLEAVHIEEQEAYAKHLMNKDQKSKKVMSKSEKKQAKLEKKKKNLMETQILEQTLIKIGALLAIGFGEAGSEIIAKNMEKNGEVNPMLPGKKILAIFGFCDIRNFTDATEVLQEEVMIFVNEIAEIVHSTVDFYGGSANKNIGDAFLLVWKFPESEIQRTKKSSDISLKGSFRSKQIADMSIFSFVKIIATIHMTNKLQKVFSF